MEEISVVVNQEVGSISWNFEEIKKNLTEKLEVYNNTVYTVDTIKTAKADVADLRKLSKEIEGRKKEVKAKCLEPYEKIEAQANELIELIKKPIDAIVGKVDDYEARRKEEVKKKIDAFWKTQEVNLPEDLRKKAYDKIYDSRWLNSTCTMKTWKETIQKGIQGINVDLQTIYDCHSDFEEEMLNVYAINLTLADAIAKMNLMNEQRERILEAERKKKEEAERREAERIAEQEAQKAEREANTDPPVEPVKDFMPKPVEDKPEAKETVLETVGNKETLTIIGTQEQIDKIKRFIKYTGADYKEGSV